MKGGGRDRYGGGGCRVDRQSESTRDQGRQKESGGGGKKIWRSTRGENNTQNESKERGKGGGKNHPFLQREHI